MSVRYSCTIPILSSAAKTVWLALHEQNASLPRSSFAQAWNAPPDTMFPDTYNLGVIKKNVNSLFHLMALANTYTISKMTSNKENSDSIVDNINDVESPERSHKYVKVHNHRKEDSGHGIKYVTTTGPKRSKSHNNIKRRNGFWGKNKNKHKTTIPINDYDSLNSVYDNVLDNNIVKDDMREKRSEYNKQINDDQNEFAEDENVSYKRAGNNSETNLKSYQKYINDVVKKLTEGQHNFTPDYKTNIKDLDTMATNRVTSPYGNEKYKPTPKILKDKIINTSPMTNAEENELATAQIEALLNEIKERAIQMVSEINPSLSDLISNTVTETTFEADPLLNKIALTTPGFVFSTFVSVNSVFDKRTVNDSDLTTSDTEINTLSPHKIDSRSLKEDGMTIAQTIEDFLQKELKGLYKKVKDTVGHDLQKEVKYAKTTINKGNKEITKKISSGTKTVNKLASTTKKKPVLRPNRGGKKSNKPTTIHSTSTVDDYVLLTLYEQILAKTHEDNVRKMVTMPAFHYVKKRNDPLIPKRNSETSIDIQLKDDTKRIYDDDVMVPDSYDFSSDINVDVSTSTNEYSDVSNQGNTEKIMTDTSYEGLTNKLSYNDYVDGYKYYLKFQKDEANANFSNLVKYQAHKHHNVDDIGKFILNKIPQVSTSKREKRAKNKIFDDNDFDDQEVSTKTDDSWFKKHFYMFVDSGPPKKFHTSQTVALKAPTVDVGTKNYLPTTTKEIEERDVGSSNTNEDARSDVGSELNLEELSKDLESQLSSPGKVDEKARIETKMETLPKSKDTENIFQNLPMIKEIQYNIGRIFGKGRRNLGSSTETNNRKSDDYDVNEKFNDLDEMEGFDMSMINKLDNANEKDFNFARFKRNSNKHTELKNKDKVTKLSTSIPINKNNIANNKKQGCVNIDLVPTQIVTLRNKKESKLKKIFNVFHKKKNKVQKRDNQRIQRFNPLKRIKDIFLSKPDDKSNNKAGLDYDLLTTKLSGFKPYKFDRVQTLEDMRNQIPNITDDSKDKSKINDIIYEYDIKKSVSDVKDAVKDSMISYTDYKFLETAESQLQSELSTPALSSKFPTFTIKQKTTPFPLNNCKYRDDMYKDNFLTINILGNITTPEFTTTNIPYLTNDDIRKELDKLQVKVTLNSNYNGKSIHKLSLTTPKIAKHEETSTNKGIIIGAKETRVAKFHFNPKEKSSAKDIVPVLETPQFYEGIYETPGMSKEVIVNKNTINDQNNNVRDLENNIEFRKNFDNNMKKSILTNKSLQNFISVLPTDLTSTSIGINDGKTIKPYPDYFNDLLMWNHDILNYDRLPQWHKLMNSDLATEYSTRDVQDIRRELNDLEELIASYHVTENRNVNNNFVTKLFEVPTIKENLVSKTPKNDLIRRVAVKEDAIGSSKEILIKGEAKYFRYDKEPVELSEEYIKKIDIINKLNNFDPKDIFHKQYARKDDQFLSKALKPSDVVELPVDSTLFSYDDDVDFVTSTLAPKKLSKNSLKNFDSLHNRTMIKPIMKINKPPKQYFATPLPMRMNNFEKFLKENNLDVASVTSPLMELPSITNQLTEKLAQGKIKDDRHKGDNTKALNKADINTNKNLNKDNTTEKAKAKNDVAAELEDLELLHKELFEDKENVRMKREMKAYDTDKYVDNINLFQVIDDEQESKLDDKDSDNVPSNDMTLIKVEEKNNSRDMVKDDTTTKVKTST